MAGRSAKPNDVWFRCITNSSHLKKDGSLHHAAFKGKAVSQPSHKKWSSEISGRLNSKAGTIELIKADGNQRANLQKERAEEKGESGSKFVFVGVLIKDVCEIRKFDFIKADVIYDPTQKPIYDEAHANFVSYDKAPACFKDPEILGMLCKNFTVIPVSDLENSPLGKK